jgi:outer membrane protein TolC
MSIRTLLSVPILIVAVVCVATLTNAQNDALRPNDNVHQLLTERRDTLQERLDAIEASFKSGRTETVVLIGAELDLLAANLELATQPVERIALLEKMVSNMKQIEDWTLGRFENGTGLRHDLLLAKAARLRAEIDLLRARDVGQ